MWIEHERHDFNDDKLNIASGIASSAADTGHSELIEAALAEYQVTRLMAAAPDLLAALKAVLNASVSNRAESHAALTLALAAIVKAERR